MDEYTTDIEKDDKTIDLKKLMKVRKTKKLTYKGIYTRFSQQIME